MHTYSLSKPCFLIFSFTFHVGQCSLWVNVSQILFGGQCGSIFSVGHFSCGPICGPQYFPCGSMLICGSMRVNSLCGSMWVNSLCGPFFVTHNLWPTILNVGQFSLVPLSNFSRPAMCQIFLGGSEGTTLYS